jgi:hypothetical protein
MRVATRFLCAVAAAFCLVGCAARFVSAVAVEGTDLRAIIFAAIRSHVHESWGELAGECFTDDDLRKFESTRVPTEIVSDLKRDKAFQQAVEKVRAMSAEARAPYLKLCRQPLHRTWAAEGVISRSGQTGAGVAAEREIAGAITDYVEGLLAAPAGASTR